MNLGSVRSLVLPEKAGRDREDIYHPPLAFTRMCTHTHVNMYIHQNQEEKGKAHEDADREWMATNLTGSRMQNILEDAVKRKTCDRQSPGVQQ